MARCVGQTTPVVKKKLFSPVNEETKSPHERKSKDFMEFSPKVSKGALKEKSRSPHKKSFEASGKHFSDVVCIVVK